jgi:hypothetical protein
VDPKQIFEAPVFNFPQPLEVEAVSHAPVTHGTVTVIAIVIGRHALLHNHTAPETTTDQIGNDEIETLAPRIEVVQQPETAGLM